MQKIIFLILIFVSFFFGGCSGVMKCNVYGTPGTKIYNSKGDSQIATIGPSGKVEIKLSRESLIPHMLYARETPSSPIIPFGLDYNKRNGNGLRAATAHILCLPTLWISEAIWWKYMTYCDVMDGLSLKKNQYVNNDLANLIANSADPLAEMRALPPREYRSGNTSKASKKNDEANFLNKSGVFKRLIRIISLNSATGTETERAAITGTLTFSFNSKYGPNRMVLNGKLKGHSKATEIVVDIPSTFARQKDKYTCKDINGKSVELWRVPGGDWCVSFNYKGLILQVEFSPDFEEASSSGLNAIFGE